MTTSAYSRKNWELFAGGRLIATNMTEPNCRVNIITAANVDPTYYAQHHTTGEKIEWSDVCAEPWPDNAGEPPPDWPYGNGC